MKLFILLKKLKLLMTPLFTNKNLLKLLKSPLKKLKKLKMMQMKVLNSLNNSNNKQMLPNKPQKL